MNSLKPRLPIYLGEGEGEGGCLVGKTDELVLQGPLPSLYFSAANSPV